MAGVLHEFMDRLDKKEAQAVFDFLDAVSRGMENVIDKADKAKNTA